MELCRIRVSLPDVPMVVIIIFDWVNCSYTELLGAPFCREICREYRKHAGAKVLFFPENDIGYA